MRERDVRRYRRSVLGVAVRRRGPARRRRRAPVVSAAVRRVAFRITADDREAVLDALLPLLPAGVREDDDGLVSSVAGSLPDRATLEAAAGGALADYAEQDVPADWRERRALFGGGRGLVGGGRGNPPPHDPPPRRRGLRP